MRVFFAFFVAGAVAACSLPPVRVETPEPIAIDVKMRLDVYQFEGVAPLDGAGPQAGGGDATTRRRDRMAEIQKLKDSRLIGENREGLLTIRDLPPGGYGAYVTNTVEAENADRTTLMEETSAKDQVPLPRVQKNIADLWRERSFPGEWVEVPGAGGAWEWVQKAG